MTPRGRTRGPAAGRARGPAAGQASGSAAGWCGRALLVALAVYAVLIGVMSGLGVLVRSSEGIAHWDAAVMNAVALGRGPVPDAVAEVIDLLGGRFSWVVIAVAVLIVGLLAGRWWTAARFGALILLPWLANTAVKAIVARPRPVAAPHPHVAIPAGSGPLPVLDAEPLIELPRSYSFPSGHTAFAAALCGAVVLTLAAGSRVRRTAFVLAIPVVLLVAWSRVLLGVHQPTDVIAAMLLLPGLSAVTAWAIPRVRPGRARGEATRGPIESERAATGRRDG